MSASVDKASDLLAFECTGNPGFTRRLYTMHPDGSNLHAIFETTTQYVDDMSWSADGVWIAFELRYKYDYRPVFGGDLDSEIFRIRFDGSVFRRVTYNDEWDSRPRWLADGKSLMSYQHGFVLRTLESGYELARIDPLHIWHFDIAPDGKTLAVVANNPTPRNYSKRVYLMNIDGSDIRDLADAGHDVSHLKWSADQRYLMIYSNYLKSFRFKPDRLRIIDATDGSDAASFELIVSDAEWSPEGRWVAVVGRESENAARELIVIDVETGARHILASEVGYTVAWSPDGKWIVFTNRERQGTNQLFKVRRDGKQLQAITELDCYIWEVSWSPI